MANDSLAHLITDYLPNFDNLCFFTGRFDKGHSLLFAIALVDSSHLVIFIIIQWKLWEYLLIFTTLTEHPREVSKETLTPL